MDWEKVFDRATLQGIRVFFYCLLVKDKLKWTLNDYCQFTGTNYEKGRKVWNAGIKDLATLGIIRVNNEGRFEFLKK